MSDAALFRPGSSQARAIVFVVALVGLVIAASL